MDALLVIGAVIGVLAVVILVFIEGETGKPTHSGKKRKVSAPKSTQALSVDSVTRQARPKAGWVPLGTTVTVAGRAIDGMVYVGEAPRTDGGWRRGIINPRLVVYQGGLDLSGNTMPYWPNYTEIGPRARGTYLDWLAGGRSDRRIGAGYVFLFFYGMERRLFVDEPPAEESRQIVTEIERLLGLYGENNSIRRYFGTFLETARIINNRAIGADFEPCFERTNYELPLDLRVVIGQKLKLGERLSADWVLSWYMLHPETRVRMPMKRAFPECRALFNVLFDEKYPHGLKVAAPKRMIRATYSAASGEFVVGLTRFVGDIPDISRTTRTTNLAKKLVETTTSELDKYSRFLGRNPQGRATIEGHALLPERIWHLFPCTEMENLRDWATGIIEKDGLAAVEQVIRQLEGSVPEKTSKRQLTGAADALARLSIGMAPDPRFALRSPKLGEPVVLFRLPGGITKLEQVSNRYKTLLVSIALGSFVAHADGAIQEKERRTLEARIDGADLPAAESVRLHANLKWMLSVPLDLGLLRRRLKDASEEVRRRLGNLALAMAATDGVIDPQEIKAIERLFKAIGLPTGDIYSSLHAHSATGGPVTVRSASKRSGEFTIPAAPDHDHRVELNTERIASLMADTARVSSVLGEIFEDEEADEEKEESVESTNGLFPGLDARLGAFLDELLTRPHWEESDLGKLAGRFQLMQDGALESLNEWSYERFDDALIEEYEGFELNPDVIKQLKS